MSVLDQYDAGLLGNGGGGDVDWWQDYIRAELQRAHEFYADQVAAKCDMVDDLREACLAIIRWDDAEKSARPFDEDQGNGFYARINMYEEAFNEARTALTKACAK